MLNLMSNAVKFTPVGGVVTLAVCPLPEGELRFEVRDTGPGIDPRQRERLFQDFVQLAGIESDEVEGTGLGLAITARLAAMMGGRIGCDGAPGGGSIFWIEIPLRQAEAPPAPALSTLPRPFVRSMRLLVVDDIAANREVARALLRSDGHIVETASDGAKAIERIALGGIDAVLMDLQMPEMDGLEATRRIRAMPAPIGQVPVLAVTASALPEQIEACREAGMDGHLSKPIERHALAQALADLRLAPGSVDAVEDVAAPDAVDPTATALIDGEVLDGLRKDLGEEVAAEIIGEFRAELDLVRGQLEDPTLDAEEAAPRLRQLAHRALGAARNLGAERLAEKAMALEIAARDGQAVALLRVAVVAVAADTAALIEAPLSPVV
ncbi:MAG: domain S-box protein, partial [Rhodospirillales bacterium]|nr:domain S-box protein [Rhodospirillales bacterium]